MEGWLSPYDLTVGSSRLFEDFSVRRGQGNDLGADFEAGTEETSSHFERCRDYKRPKVLGFPL